MTKANLINRTLATINLLVVVGLWITGFLSGLNPEKWGWLSLIGYAFPFFILATIFFFIPWLFIRKRCMLISFLGLLVAYYPVTLYCPINSTEENSSSLQGEGFIKVMSYNVCNWGIGYDNNDITINNKISNEEKYQIMVDYFRSVDADIVAVQEGNLHDYLDTLKTIYHYSDTVNTKNGECAVMLLSKFPITRKENLHIPSNGNGAGAFWLNIKGKETIVIATHLESMRLSVDDKDKFSIMLHGNNENTDSLKNTSKIVFGKILLASKKRAPQARLIAQFINKHIGINIIVMGDFNDIPQSYTHDIICDQLKDCYREKGLGTGFSYSHFGIKARIDNILCSINIEPKNCIVDDNINLSDHLPIIATMKIK